MQNFEKNIDKMISKILKEEIEIKSKTILERLEEGGEWTEIEVDEELHGGQKKLDKNKNGKIDAHDFKLLRKKSKKKEMDEFFEDESNEDAEEKSQNEPTYVGKGLEDNKLETDLENKMLDFDRKMRNTRVAGKLFGSFDDEHGWWDQDDHKYDEDFDFDYDEEEFPDFDSLMSRYGKQQKWFAPERKASFTSGGSDGRKFFDLYQKKFGGAPFRVRKLKVMDEAETEEGNAFTGALEDAKEKGKKTFEVDGKTFPVKEGKEKKCPKCGMTNCKCNHKKETNEKWEGDVEVKQTGEYSDMSIEDLNKAIKKQKTKNDKTKEAGKKVSDSDRTKMSQLYFAKRAKQGWKGKGKAAVKENLQLTEEELIDLIENIVKEQKVKDVAEKNNITTKKAEGLKKTEKVLKADKKENDDYAKQVVKKMKEYVKAGSLGEFNESPEKFPESNYSMSKMKEKTMKYHPSKAVDEYIEAFAFPGMTNLVYDEIKPDDEKIKKYIKGDRTTGNAEVDEEGKALGNVVPSEVGERFMKNYEDNLYGAEQMNVSYKRQPQPVDVGGSEKMEGSLKSIRKGSTQKAQKIMNQLESKETTTENVITEEMSRMMNLISYNKKTQ